MWPNIAHMIGMPELMDDPRFLTSDDRSENRAALESIFQSWLDGKTRMEAFDAAQRAGLPGGPVLEALEVADNEHFIARDYFRRMARPEGGELTYTGLPFRLSDAPEFAPSPAPQAGGDTRGVLASVLGMSETEISELARLGVTRHV